MAGSLAERATCATAPGATLRGEAVCCARCGLLLGVRTALALVAAAGSGALYLDPSAITCERCGAVWSNPDSLARAGR